MKFSFKEYKSFTNNEVFIEIKPINVLIGKNNSGKSSIGDVIEFCSKPHKHLDILHKIKGVRIKAQLTEAAIKLGFNKGTSGGGIPGDHYAYGIQFINKEICYSLSHTKRNDYGSERIHTEMVPDTVNSEIIKSNIVLSQWSRVAEGIGNIFNKYEVLRVLAERDIQPEVDSKELNVESNGVGVTNIIHKFINRSDLDSKLVERDILNGLNQIMFPDSVYKDIVVQQIDDIESIKWEVFLEEANGRRIPLSDSGSGLKTVLIVLTNLILLPKVLNKNLSGIIFIFEELENNLHPALQRNLFNYIKDTILKSDSKVYFTTHSHVAINIFDRLEESQLFHIQRIGEVSIIEKVDSFLSKKSILNDLEVSASDLLQSNGIIWVEGPSDRVYVNRWIDLVGKNQFKENIHYQIMYYGGKILSHLTFDDLDTEDVDKFIKMIGINRNSAILIDSDKHAKNSPINKTKERIKAEIIKNGSFCWITKGREIENYLTDEVITRSLGIKNNKAFCFDRYQNIDDYLDLIRDGEGKRFLRNKVGYSLKFCQNIVIDDLTKYDHQKDIQLLLNEIKKWNYIKE